MNDSVINKQNNTLNFLKGLACFAIVWMHTNSGGLVNQVIVCMARFGIPIFFMVSGYFTYKKGNGNYTQILAKKILHIIKLIIIATAVYMVWYWVFQPFIQTGHMPNILLNIQKNVSSINWIDLFVFNVNPFCGILWFLNTLLYCYLIWLLIAKIKDKRIVYIIAAIVLFVGILLRIIILKNNIIPEDISINYFRNWIFYGLPFFAIGHCIHEYKDKIIESIKISYLVIAIIIGFAMSFVERLVAPLEVFVGTVFVSVALFIFAIKKPDIINTPILNKVGEKYCFFIYIAHIIVRDIVLAMYDYLKIKTNVLLWVNPIIVFALCYLLAMSYYLIRGKIKRVEK